MFFSENHYISNSFIPYLVKRDFKVKLERLKDTLRQKDSVIVAFSGGTDSAFLLKIAHEILDDNVVAVTVLGPTFSKRECKDAVEFANNVGVRHSLIESEEVAMSIFLKNSVDRCYYCKKEVFSKIKQVADKNNLKFVLDGSNADDIDDYRPGFKAIHELGVISPLKDVGLTKDEIRYLSKQMGLDTWDKPAFACLASRFPYGAKITKEKLAMVEKAEEFILSFDVKQFRVRHHEDIARIEVLKQDFQKIVDNSDEIVKKFKEIGFKYVTMDIQGYRTGSLNEVLDL